MKYLMLAAIFTFGSFSTLYAQKQSAPAAVWSAFRAKFPNVQKVKWDEAHKGEWEAEFKMAGTERSAVFSRDGIWIETETEIQVAGLPAAVQRAVTAQFTGYKIEEAAMVETPGLAMGYEVGLEKGGATIEALFSSAGTLIRQMSETQEDNDNN
ncbi:MAG: PepSY-like domain-containing protein [Phaeodactylibacter sp.]|nr:PepSY-like domain-containing protein [Phaeodactylibacter sp.]MCB9277065.1 PepSY-like domain-containing protein [Lewinellaceae bacterium]